MFTPQQRIERMKVSLMRHKRLSYLACVLMLGDMRLSEDMPTAWTDGKDVMFNPKYISKLTDAELRALIFHEYGGHIMFQHLTAFRHLFKQNPTKANYACDYVVNAMIVDFDEPEFMSLPAGGLYDPQYDGMDSVQVFRLLPDDTGKAGAGGSGSGKPMDEHDWEGAGSRTTEGQKALEEAVEQAVRQGAMAASLSGGSVDRRIQDWLTPKVNWRDALREFVTATCVGTDEYTYRKPKRRWLGQDIYMPTSFGHTAECIVVAVDTSGSVSDDEMCKVLGEVESLCQTVRPERVELLYWGSGVVGHETYGADSLDGLRHATRPVGGGGTNVTAVPAYLSARGIRPDCTVVLTDGYVFGGWGEWDCPVLWAMTTREVAPVGVTIRLED
jgi:predicted metal-dependent peptidase